MHYEIHITVKTTNIEKFKIDCKEIGVKPIVIEIQNEDLFEKQVMTSSKYIGDDYTIELGLLTSALVHKGYEIIRQKVEIKPEENKHKDFIYYESHFRLKFPKVVGFKFNILERLRNELNGYALSDLCKELNFHLSKNILKSDEHYIYQMITYRNYNKSYDEFVSHLDVMKKRLSEVDEISIDKVEIEEAIFDSNINVDNNWFKK